MYPSITVVDADNDSLIQYRSSAWKQTTEKEEKRTRWLRTGHVDSSTRHGLVDLQGYPAASTMSAIDLALIPNPHPSVFPPRGLWEKGEKKAYQQEHPPKPAAPPFPPPTNLCHLVHIFPEPLIRLRLILMHPHRPLPRLWQQPFHHHLFPRAYQLSCLIERQAGRDLGASTDRIRPSRRDEPAIHQNRRSPAIAWTEKR